MILIIDHHDSFVHNLARYVRLCGEETTIMRADHIEKLEELPKALILSPGPCSPTETPQTVELIKKSYKTCPILGVCLGHQCIAEAFGGRTIKSEAPIHGKSSKITHNGDAIFKNISSPFTAGRYHSLISDIDKCEELTPIAYTEDNVLMGFKHKNYPTYGLQFHPESILTKDGRAIVKNFIEIANR